MMKHLMFVLYLYSNVALEDTNEGGQWCSFPCPVCDDRIIRPLSGEATVLQLLTGEKSDLRKKTPPFGRGVFLEPLTPQKKTCA